MMSTRGVFSLCCLVECVAAFSPLAIGTATTPQNPRSAGTTSSRTSLREMGSDMHDLYWLHENTMDEDDLYGDIGLFSDEDDDEDTDLTLGEHIARGEVVMCIPDVASSSECTTLFEAGLAAAQKQESPASRGRSRFSVSDPNSFPSEIVLLAEEIILRAMDHLDLNVPSIYDCLFRPSDEWVKWQPLNAQLEQPEVPPPEYLAETCGNLRELYMMGELEWSEGEPAINIYESNGYFGAHKDHLALTILIPLTGGEDFSGGGTGFWAGNRNVDENPSGPPDEVLKPPPGSALIFGGDVTHSGMTVDAGYRSVLVCSFSTRTEASAEDRLHGLQAPPTVSANFKGTM